MRIWLGVALLAACWLPGVGYYHQTNWLAWAVLVASGMALLWGALTRLPGRGEAGAAALLLLPAIWVAPWPYRVGLVLIALGLVLQLPTLPPDWLRKLAACATLTGLVLLAQSLAVLAYTHLTARSHELPWPLPALLGAVLRCLGFGTAIDGTRLAVWTMRAVQRLGATWELLVDPATVCLLVGGLVLLAVQAWAGVAPALRGAALRRAVLALIAALAVWLPVRVGIVLGLYVHGVLRTDYDTPLDQSCILWSTTVHFALLLPPALLAWRFARLPAADPAPALARADWRRPVAFAALAAAGMALLCLGLWWQPVGARRSGRVIVDEHHSQWERTDRPYDTTWYGHESGYNYSCIYDYCSRFYDMSRQVTGITDSALKDCSVLVIKVPTQRYAPEEVQAITRFVQGGGGLLLIGEHTDYSGSGRSLNEIARNFGFSFRYDCLLGIDDPFNETIRPPLVPHPIIQNLPPFDFAVSASVAPGNSRGRAVIIGTGLKGLHADYHVDNFYPQVGDHVDMRYGSFVQLWAAPAGRGRVVAFTDSTVFSNFATFEPGKAELMLGMLEWLNRGNGPWPLRWLLLVIALVCLGASLRLRRGCDDGWVVLVAAATLGWALAIPATRTLHRWEMPSPAAVRPLTQVIIDQTVGAAKLPISGFIDGKPEGFGVFERWVLRLGYFTVRRAGAEALTGNMLVVLLPQKPVPPEFQRALVRYVSEGGRVLVVDSAQNAASTAGSLLWPFGLGTRQSEALAGGTLNVPAGWPTVTVDSAYPISGGRPFAYLLGNPVGVTQTYGKGVVTFVAFGSRFSDANMGATGDTVPDATMQQVYALEFTLLRAVAAGTLR